MSISDYQEIKFLHEGNRAPSVSKRCVIKNGLTEEIKQASLNTVNYYFVDPITQIQHMERFVTSV